MRIIAGEHRGRKLLGPVDKATTRPITDRVKTALFDRLSAAGRLTDAVVLDLFSGTGSMGLECLSRGAAFVALVERDRVALQRLKKNLEAIGETQRAAVLAVDALSNAVRAKLKRNDLTLIFCDPPYRMMEQPDSAAKVVGQLTALALLCVEDADLVLRTPNKVEPPTIERWSGVGHYQYGSMTLHHYRRDRFTPPNSAL